MTRIIVLSDTHVQPGGSRQLPDAVYEHLESADRILHAGDVVTGDLLHQLEAFAPVTAVLGNNDFDLIGVLPEIAEFDIDGIRFAMLHDSGARTGRAERMHRRFPDADVVVFGHSHEPCDEEGVDGQRLFNPGSSTWKRRAPTHTIGALETRAGALVSHRIIDV